MINKAKLETQLDTYAQLLIGCINNYAYVPEFINGEVSSLANTRLLCQTRSIFFLVDYAHITKNPKYITDATQLAKVIQSNYFCQNQQRFFQYPVINTTQNTPADKLLYELAFVICAFAKLYAVNQDKSFLQIISQTKAYIFSQYYNRVNKFEAMLNPQTGLNQNSFMHLFEAMLEAVSIIDDVQLHNEFHDFANDLLSVIYDNSAQLIRENSLVAIYEPGHSFEWASLLLEAQQKNLFKSMIDYNSLVSQAEKYGVSQQQLVFAEIQLDAKPHGNVFRIWPLLEQIRFYAMRAQPEKLDIALSALNNVFFSKDNLPYEYVNDKLEPQQTLVKSTTGYHIINCYKYILQLSTL